MDFLQSVPIFIWILLPSALAFVLGFTLSKSLRMGLGIGALVALALTFIWSLFHWIAYLENHFVGSYDVSGLPSDFSHSGWRLIFDSWELWLFPAMVLALISTVLTWFFRPQNETLVPFDDELPSIKIKSVKPNKISSDRMIAVTLENEKLRHRLAVSEEKYRIAKEKSGGLSPKDTRTTLDIKQLREQLIDCKRAKTSLRKELDTMSKDLERTNHLVDQLLEEKYGGGS